MAKMRVKELRWLVTVTQQGKVLWDQSYWDVRYARKAKHKFEHLYPNARVEMRQVELEREVKIRNA